jgi:DNA-binding LacI/PurR family transcriptional regulator
MAVGIKEIGEHVGVSVSTVSHILSGRSTRYAAKTREAVLAGAKELGYVPNATARALVTGRTNRIAFWVPDFAGRFFHEQMCRFNRLLLRDHYELVVAEFDEHMSDPSRAMGFARMDVDGVLIYGGGRDGVRGILDRHFLAKVPVVNLGMYCESKLDFVKFDMRRAARDAVQYLIQAGRRRIAHLHIEKDERYEAYLDALQEAGLPPELIPCQRWTKADVLETVKKHVHTRGCPEAIFCWNDEAAMATLCGLRELGRRVPEDVWLVGCDGIEDLDYLDAPISTIMVPMEKVCATAWKFLRNRMRDPEIGQQTAEFAARFVIRPDPALRPLAIGRKPRGGTVRNVWKGGPCVIQSSSR